MTSRKPHDQADYRQRRALLMASITPASKCWRCGRTAAEHPQFHGTGRRASWQAGHMADGNNAGPLSLEWSTCNLAAGGKLGAQRKRAGAIMPHYPGHYNPSPTSLGAPPCAAATGALCPTCRSWHRSNPTTTTR